MSNKKNIILFSLALFGIMAFFPNVSHASVLKFSSTTVNYSPGQTFFFNVTLDPQGVANYTSKIEINFPADLMKVNSFTFGDNWTPISLSGYDLIDNTNGVLIKTAGYPGGVTTPLSFGTISFTTLKEGTGAITVNSNSSILGASGQNLLTGTAEQASVTVKTLAQSPTSDSTTTTTTKKVTKPVVKTTPITEKITTTSPVETTTPQQTTTVAANSATTNSPTASAGLLNGFMNYISSGGAVIWLLVAVLFIAAIYALYTVFRPAKKERSKNTRA